MQIEALENEIVAALQTALGSDYEVKANPENIEEFSIAFDKTRVWVGYQQSDFGDLESTRVVTQDEDVTVILTLQSRTLRGDTGIYATKKKVQDVLLGKVPGNCYQKFYAIYFGPPKHDDVLCEDAWTFEYHIKTATKAVQAVSDNDTQLTPNYVESNFLTTVVNTTPQITTGNYQP